MDTRGTAIVVGAGVIGLANAFRLARDGWRVSVLDPASGRGATWAAAGMIAPHAEISPGEEANFRRQLGAALAWRELSDELVQSGGQSIDLHVVGTLIVGFDGADRQLVEQLRAVALDFGVTGERVSRSDHSDLFRAITPRVRDGLYFDGDAWVDPDQIVASLTAAARALGVKFCRRAVTGARADAEGVEVTTDDGIYRGDVGVWCTGSSPLPDGLAHRTAQSVRPVRGMTIRVRGVDRAGLATLRAYVRGRPWYFVSRSADYGVIGASSDEQADLGVELGEAPSTAPRLS